MATKQNTKNRLSITFDDWTMRTLEEVALLDRSSVARVVRDCVRGMLPQMAEVSRFLADPHTTDAGALRLAADMEGMLARIAAGLAGVGPADEAGPTTTSTPPKSPRSVTRGLNTPKKTI